MRLTPISVGMLVCCSAACSATSNDGPSARMSRVAQTPEARRVLPALQATPSGAKMRAGRVPERPAPVGPASEARALARRADRNRRRR